MLAWLLNEGSAEHVRTAMDMADTVVTSTLTLAEARRVLVRLEAVKGLRAGDGQRIRGALDRACRGWMTAAVTEQILETASRPFPVEPIRTLDAIHLATALELARALPDLKVLSLDPRIAENSVALGLS